MTSIIRKDRNIDGRYEKPKPHNTRNIFFDKSEIKINLIDTRNDMEVKEQRVSKVIVDVVDSKYAETLKMVRGKSQNRKRRSWEAELGINEEATILKNEIKSPTRTMSFGVTLKRLKWQRQEMN